MKFPRLRVEYVLFLLCLVATSIGDKVSRKLSLETGRQRGVSPMLNALQRQMETSLIPGSGILDMIMLGLAGIPVYKAVGLMMPLFRRRTDTNKNDKGRVYPSHNRSKRDLAYAKQLLALLISVETALEKYGITEPQCQLRATCEIHKKGGNDISSGNFERNFIKLVREMRREIANPRVIPMAKCVFEFYETAAERGEEQSNCKEKYPKCLYSLDYFMKRTKGEGPQVHQVMSNESYF